MNLALSDPFASLGQDYPESLTSHLSHGHAVVVSFNKSSRYLAAGLLDGQIVIWDFDTLDPACKLTGHIRSITSLCWSRSGRYLLSSSVDWKCILWDLKEGTQVRSISFESPVWGSDLHPVEEDVFCCTLFEDSAQIVHVKEESIVRDTLPTKPKDNNVPAHPAAHWTLACVYNNTGQYIIAGTSQGWINVITSATQEVIYSSRLTNANIKQIRLSSNGRDMVVNPSDRIIRTLHIPDFSTSDDISLDVEHRFSDVINRLQWNTCRFSSSGEYVMASTFKNHDIYVWERSLGSLVKILEGPKEELVDCDWHATRPCVVAVGVETGTIYVWSTITAQRWSALAPDFVEVEDNIEYKEREDEFDIVPPEEADKRKMDEEEVNIDLVTVEPTRGFEALNGQFVIPVESQDIQNLPFLEVQINGKRKR